MIQKIFLSTLIASVLVMLPSAHAGKVELTTYYPSPHGEYKDVKASGSVEVGTTAAPGTFKLVDGNQAAGKLLVSDADGVGTWQAATGGACYIDYSMAAGQAVGTAIGGGFTIAKDLGTYGFCYGRPATAAYSGPMFSPPGAVCPSGTDWMARATLGEAYLCCHS